MCVDYVDCVHWLEFILMFQVLPLSLSPSCCPVSIFSLIKPTWLIWYQVQVFTGLLPAFGLPFVSCLFQQVPSWSCAGKLDTFGNINHKSLFPLGKATFLKYKQISLQSSAPCEMTCYRISITKIGSTMCLVIVMFLWILTISRGGEWSIH